MVDPGWWGKVCSGPEKIPSFQASQQSGRGKACALRAISTKECVPARAASD